MPDYRVSWEIDIVAASPEDAARQAREIQLRPSSIANVFDVSDGEDITRVDLEEVGCEGIVEADIDALFQLFTTDAVDMGLSAEAKRYLEASAAKLKRLLNPEVPADD